MKQLEALVKRDQAQIESAVTILISEYGAMKNLVKNHLKNLLIEKISSIKSNWNQEGKKFNSSEVAKLIELATGNSLLSFSLERSDGSGQNLKAELRQCWKYQADLRASAVCSTCSANSTRFFDADKGLGLADMEVCGKLVENCGISIFHMNWLINAFNALIDNYDLLQKAGIQLNTNQRTKSIFFKRFF